MAQGILRFAEGRSDLLRVDPRRVRWTPGIGGRDFDAPENQRHLHETKASIIVHGVRNPITVRIYEDELWLVDGEVRLRATMLAIEEGADIKTIPAIAEEKNRGEADRIVDQITRNTGKRFEPIELGRMCKRLEDYGWKQKDIADRLAMSPANVSHVIALLGMPEPVQAAVRDGTIAAATALSLVREEGPEQAATIIEEAREEVVPHTPIHSETGSDTAPPPPTERAEGAKRVTPKAIERARQKKAGGTAPAPRTKTPGQNMSSLYDALFTQINKFLTRCQDGTYEDEEHELSERLTSDAKELAESILLTRRGFKDMERDEEGEAA